MRFSMQPPKARAVLVLCLLCLAACDDEKPKAQAAPAPSAVPQAAPAAPAPVASEAPPRALGSSRPDKIDTELTATRRAAVEAKHPEATGFVVGKELEEKLKSNKAIKAKEGALTAFDRAAKGKWVLFSGAMVNLTDNGFDVGIVYTPQLANDVMGMSRQFFEVTLTEVQGYEPGKFKAGNVVVVLAKYQGAGKASPGYELVAENSWK